MNLIRTLPRVSFLRLALIAAIVVSLVGVGVFVAPHTSARAAVTFRNPLNSSGPDPWMTYYNGYYYLATTTWGGASTGLTMRKAATIAELKTVAPVRVWQDSTSSRCCNYWAPSFHLLNGPNGMRWYLYYTGGPATCCDNQHIYVVESVGLDPMGPYTYKGQLTDSTGGWMIDQSILELNGSLYLLFSAFNGAPQNIYIAPMSNPWTVSGSRVLLSSPTLTWEQVGSPDVNEGPVALQHNGQTFIVYSASFCGTPDYKLGMLTYTGSNPLSTSSWTKKSTPIFQQGNGVYGPAHNGFFKSPDGTEDWIVYHGNSSAGGGCDMNRTTRIQKFTWNADGTPNLGTPASTTTDLNVPSGEGSGVNPTPTRTNTPTTGPSLTPTRTPTPLPGGSNLALGKTASADSAQAANPAASGNDGSTSTRWCAADGNLNHWWKVDLGASHALTGSEVMWEFARNYKYKVEVSTDNTNWTLVVDKTGSTSTAQTQTDNFTATARYVRITVTGLTTSPTTWASFFEFRVFGT